MEQRTSTHASNIVTEPSVSQTAISQSPLTSSQPQPHPSLQPQTSKSEHQTLTTHTPSSTSPSSFTSSQPLPPVHPSAPASLPINQSSLPSNQSSHPISITTNSEAGSPSHSSSFKAPTNSINWRNQNQSQNTAKGDINLEEMEIDELVDDDNDIASGQQRDNEDEGDDLSSFSSSLSMDEDDEDDMVANASERRGTLPTSARKRTSGVESHSDSESQFDSALESHPNSDSESDPDLESRPQSPRPFKSSTHRLNTSTSTTATNTLSNDVRRLSTHSIRHQSHIGGDPLRFTDINEGNGNRRQNLDLPMAHDEALRGLSTLAVAARKLPRREPISEGGASAHDDSNASESEG
ncbi:hypothetical protein BGX27_000636 [Mortierella sp. AM989]|nr:hypothetical protein BGX27_000636 [Mortierella sp. AM989]